MCERDRESRETGKVRGESSEERKESCRGVAPPGGLVVAGGTTSGTGAWQKRGRRKVMGMVQVVVWSLWWGFWEMMAGELAGEGGVMVAGMGGGDDDGGVGPRRKGIE